MAHPLLIHLLGQENQFLGGIPTLRNPVWLSGSHVNTEIHKDIWVQKLLEFSKAHTSYSKSFTKHTAKLSSLAVCNGEAAISPFSSVWGCSVWRLLNGKGPGWLALGEKKGRSTVNRRNLMKRRWFIYIFNFWRSASMLGTSQKENLIRLVSYLITALSALVYTE